MCLLSSTSASAAHTLNTPLRCLEGQAVLPRSPGGGGDRKVVHALAHFVTLARHQRAETKEDTRQHLGLGWVRRAENRPCVGL